MIALSIIVVIILLKCFFPVERYSPLYGKELSNDIQTFLKSRNTTFEDGCQRVKFFYEYCVEIAGFITNEHFDVVK
jgi:hypothetical protein